MKGKVQSYPALYTLLCSSSLYSAPYFWALLHLIYSFSEIEILFCGLIFGLLQSLTTVLLRTDKSKAWWTKSYKKVRTWTIMKTVLTWVSKLLGKMRIKSFTTSTFLSDYILIMVKYLKHNNAWFSYIYKGSAKAKQKASSFKAHN